MKRWKTTLNGYPIKFYGKSEEDIAKISDDGAEITLDEDNSFLEYIEKIKESSEFLGHERLPSKHREVYKMPYSSKYILVKLAIDDEDGTYYDVVAYQRHDNIFMIEPFDWQLSSPKEFCDDFMKEYVYLPQGYEVTYSDIKKLGLKKIYSKDGQVYWKDDLGYFYYANKCDLPTKKSRVEYNTFKGNGNAVFVEWSCASPDNPNRRGYDWFKSLGSFMDWWKTETENCPTYFATPTYEVKRCGYKKVAPEDRKVILRLSLFDLELEKKESSNPIILAHNWYKLCRGWFDDILGCEKLLESVVKQSI